MDRLNIEFNLVLLSSTEPQRVKLYNMATGPQKIKLWLIVSYSLYSFITNLTFNASFFHYVHNQMYPSNVNQGFK